MSELEPNNNKGPTEAQQRALRRELGEPDEMRNPVPWPVAAASVLLIAWGAWYYFQNAGYPLLAGDQRTPVSAVAALATADGGTLYVGNCSACHQASGAGLAGVFPPLAGSEWVTRDAKRLVQILLFGIQGEIEVSGAVYNGVMPAFAQLSDTELATILTHVRSSWGNSAAPISAADIAQGRLLFPERTAPWGGGAELNSVFPPPAP